MADAIFGDVQRVIDGDTVELVVRSRSRNNLYSYRRVERVRLRDVYAPEMNTRQGRQAQQRLESRLLGKRVRVDVAARDDFGRVVGIVKG